MQPLWPEKKRCSKPLFYFRLSWSGRRTWCRAVIPAILILLTSMWRLARRSMTMIASPSASLIVSSNTISSGNLTLRRPGCCRAKNEARRDMLIQVLSLERSLTGHGDLTNSHWANNKACHDMLIQVLSLEHSLPLYEIQSHKQNYRPTVTNSSTCD